MGSTNTRYKDILDYTVSYRAMWTILGFAVAFAVAGWFAWDRFRPPGEDEKARQDIKTAERLQERATSCLTPETSELLRDRLVRGGEELGAARQSLEAQLYAETSASARTASGLFREFVDRVCATRDAVAHFVMLEGDVKVKKAQALRWVDARPETALVTGDRIQTRRGVARIAYLLSDEMQEIREDTIIEIKSHEVRGDGKARTQTAMEFGEISMRGAPGTGSTIETQHGTIEPDGDIVGVESPEGSEATRWRSTRGGSTVTARGGQRARLSAMQRVDADAAGLGLVQPLLPGPELAVPPDGRFFSYEEPAGESTRFEWREVPGARGYVYQLGRNDVFLPVLNERDQLVDVLDVVVPALPPRQYWWRVASLDADGVQGPWSETRRLTIRAGAPREDRPPPKLVLAKPISLHDRVIIKGETAPYVTLEVHVNDRKVGNVDVAENGSFQTIVLLAVEGRNRICFIAHDAYGTEGRACVEQYYRPF